MLVFWKILFGGIRSSSVWLDLALLIARLWVGIPMAFVFGIGKLPPPSGFVSSVADLGFPMPSFFAWCAALAEIVGGGLLILGVMTRPAALFLGFTMFVAAFMAKADLSFFDPGRMNPTHFLVFCVLLLLTGAGRLSVDQILRPKPDGKGLR